MEGIEAPGTLGVAQFPSVIVPVCVKATPCVSGVVASVPGCVLPGTPSVSEKVCVDETPGMNEAPCVSEQPCVSEARGVRKTACVRSLYLREMMVGMREHAAASPGVNVMVRCVSLLTHRSACVEWSLSARVRRR